ncbi:hypothetical protein FNV43_RR13486 [Rhamnella rubrinervis]|uniref:Uncharacterized protein n=1 Tax=Rhamnella rubrinervis TaxID=2594499 RepID=A0A8K0MF96_9ROSA|nr:hypothetical protein FNV43_RR13486 [Rhamnella rubrinervis]
MGNGTNRPLLAKKYRPSAFISLVRGRVWFVSGRMHIYLFRFKVKEVKEDGHVYVLSSSDRTITTGADQPGRGSEWLIGSAGRNALRVSDGLHEDILFCIVKSAKGEKLEADVECQKCKSSSRCTSKIYS